MIRCIVTWRQLSGYVLPGHYRMAEWRRLRIICPLFLGQRLLRLWGMPFMSPWDIKENICSQSLLIGRVVTLSLPWEAPLSIVGCFGRGPWFGIKSGLRFWGFERITNSFLPLLCRWHSWLGGGIISSIWRDPPSVLATL